MGCFKQTALARSKPLGLQTFSSKNKLCRKLQPTYNLLDWMKEVLSHILYRVRRWPRRASLYVGVNLLQSGAGLRRDSTSGLLVVKDLCSCNVNYDLVHVMMRPE